jgi:hypothetical protein
MPKGYWKASSHFVTVIKNCREMPKLKLNPMGKCSYWLGVRKSRKWVSKKETRQNFPLVIGKNEAISVHFLSSTAF